jgi:hypothetical protein
LAAPNSRPSKSAVRAALLSARLYHDTLENNSLLRYAGFGVLDRDRALEILKGDAEQPDPYVPWLSLARLTMAFSCLPPDQKDDRANDVGAIEQGLLSVSRLPDPQAAALLAADVDCSDRAPLTNARNWKTTVTRRGRVTVVVSEMEILADLKRVALMCDPRQWENVSLFWYESTPVKGAPEGPTPSIDDPTAEPKPWTGILRETVAGMGVMTVYLGVDYDYQVEEDRCTVDYWFKSSPDSKLSRDDGKMTVIKMDDGWLKSRVLKEIDFEDALFGGPSSADLLAPSFIATWMRVQQDFWAARAMDSWRAARPSL